MADRSGWVQALLSWAKFEQGINEAPWRQTDQDALFSRCLELSNRYSDREDVGDAMQRIRYLYEDWPHDIQLNTPVFEDLLAIADVVRDWTELELGAAAGARPSSCAALIVGATPVGDGLWMAVMPPPIETSVLRAGFDALEGAVQEIVTAVFNWDIPFLIIPTSAVPCTACAHIQAAHTPVMVHHLNDFDPAVDPFGACCFPNCDCQDFVAIDQPA